MLIPNMTAETLVAHVQAAKMMPRKSQEEILKDVLDKVCLDKDIIESYSYSYPTRKKTDLGRYETVDVKGPSIRLAEIIYSCYSNLKVGVKTEDILNEKGWPVGVKVFAWGWDVENNNEFFDETRRTFQKYHDHKTHQEICINDRNKDREVAAGAAFARRNTIFRLVGGAFVNKILNEITRMVMTLPQYNPVTPEFRDRVDKAFIYFRTLGVHEKTLLDYFGYQNKQEFKPEDLLVLQSKTTELKEGQIRIEDLFTDKITGPNVLNIKTLENKT